MSQKEDILEQRDRFLAFAFAGADLLMEIDAENRVAFSFGAVKQLTGFDDKGIKGRVWTDLFLETDRPLLKDMMRTASVGRRCGPVLVTIQDNGHKKTVSTLFTAIKMPGRNSLYITLAFPNALMSRQGTVQREKEEANALLSKEDFIKNAQSAIKAANAAGQQVDMTLLELPDMKTIQSHITKDNWDQMLGTLATLLKERSLDGQTATRLSDNQYGLVHDKTINAKTIQDQIVALLKEADPEAKNISVKGSSVEANLDTLSEKEASRALMYTLNSFEKNGAQLTIESLNDSFKSFLNENTKKIQKFKLMTVHLDFYLSFQPIVSLSTLKASHYEMLARFRDGSTPYEWITFGEEVGLAADFDMAVCTQAIRYVSKLPKDTKTKFAINISGQSIESEYFMSDLRRNIGANKALANLLMFEITESSNIKDLDKVNNFIGQLQKDGFHVCLDDFGAGSASFQYLHKLHVNYVKLDGAYVQTILDNKRNQTMVRNLAQLCRDLDVGMVAEHIETEEEAILLRNMGVGYGQGYWFSKPMATPEYEVNDEKLKRLFSVPMPGR